MIGRLVPTRPLTSRLHTRAEFHRGFATSSMLPLWSWLMLGYVTVSLVCLHFPSLTKPLTRRREVREVRVRRSVKFAAHRGGAAERPESTIAAFDHAVSQGCTLLELDVHLTSDGRVAVIHDADTRRTTGVSGLVMDTKFADLPPSKKSMPAPPPFSNTLMTYDTGAVPGTVEFEHAYGVPALETVLERYKDSVINIDCKDDSDELVDAVAELIERHDASDRVIVGSMHQRAMTHIQQRMPHVRTFFSPKAVLRTYLKYWLGVLPFTRLEHDVFEIPYLTHEIRGTIAGMLARRLGSTWSVRAVDAAGWLMLRPSFIAHLKARGIPVVVWVVNSEAEARDAFALGVSGVMTDRPSMFAAFNPTEPSEDNH